MIEYDKEYVQKYREKAITTIISFNDNNIGASYNPWLIFADKETMEEYKKELEITRDPDDDFSDYEWDDDDN